MEHNKTRAFALLVWAIVLWLFLHSCFSKLARDAKTIDTRMKTMGEVINANR